MEVVERWCHKQRVDLIPLAPCDTAILSALAIVLGVSEREALRMAIYEMVLRHGTERSS